MPSIADIRKQYPQYSDLSDDQLAHGLHDKFYADMPYDQFAQKIGLQHAKQPFVGPTQEQLSSGVEPKRSGLGPYAQIVANAAGNAGLNMLGPLGSTAAAMIPENMKGKMASTVAEGLAPSVSGMVAGPIAGYAGIAGAALPGPPGQGAEWTQATQNALTYSPRMASGQTAADVMSLPGATLNKYAGRAGGAVSDVTGSPFLGAATKSAIDVGVPTLVGGALMRGVNAALPEPRAPAPSLTDLKTAADALYKAGRSSPEIAPQSALAPVIADVEQMLTDNGFDPENHPASARSLNRLYQEATKPGIVGHNATGLEAFRRVLTGSENRAYNAQNWDDFRIANEITDRFDQMVREAAPSAGESFGEARSTFASMRKTQTLEQLITRAENRANGQNQAGYENALRTQFQQLADSKRFAQFTPDEQAAILETARGSGWFQTATRNVGRGAIRGPITAGFAAIMAAAHGSPLTLAGILLTEIARKGATSMRENSALAARDLVASGGQAVAQPTAPPLGPNTFASPALMAPSAATQPDPQQIMRMILQRRSQDRVLTPEERRKLSEKLRNSQAAESVGLR